jgi:hypothetical protein
MSNNMPILLVGSVPLKDTEAVLRALGDKLGVRALRYPDGETGGRINWIAWQGHIFEKNPIFLLDGVRAGYSSHDDLPWKMYKLAEGVADKNIKFPSLGYAAEATKSYAVFSRLKKEGTIPEGTKFQVSLPTVAPILNGFLKFEDRARCEAALEKAMQREVEELAKAVPADELAIQWDIASEIIAFDMGRPYHYENTVENSAKRIAKHIAFAPKGVESGIHLCYGDPGHKHIVEPKDTGTEVKFANAISAAADRALGWIHMPIPREWTEERYFAPLADLKLPSGTELYLGLFHIRTGEDANYTRARAAQRYVKKFGIATECGLGRRDPASIPGLLELMSRTSEAIAKMAA